MNSNMEPPRSSLLIPPEILELVTNNGQFDLPSAAVLDGSDSIVIVRLRSYWGRLAELASGRVTEADRWLSAYNWAVEQESRP
jgi:hypothetical protein